MSYGKLGAVQRENGVTAAAAVGVYAVRGLREAVIVRARSAGYADRLPRPRLVVLQKRYLGSGLRGFGGKGAGYRRLTAAGIIVPRGGPEGKILGDVFSRVGGVFIGIGAFRRYDVPVRLETLRQRCTCAQAAGDFLAFRIAHERRKCGTGESAGRAERYQLEAGGVTAAADGEAVLDGVFRVGGHPELRGKHRKAQLGFLAAVHCERDHRAGLHAALHHGLLSDLGGGQAVG